MEIPGYEIKQTIGQGGMATVYLAIQESLGRSVVLKIMNAERGDNPDFFERFLNEGRIVAALRHPNIITIYDIGAADGLVYISMEYVEGGDLKTRIQERIAPGDALDILVRIGSALDFAHQEGVIHRDVKPANILFRRDGTALLSDFGIAKQVKVDNELTSTGTILGSPFYMSPEQAEGLKVDGRADLYSLGIIFYEMLTGERPYQGDSPIKVIMQHLQAPVPTLPGELARFQGLLDGMLAKRRQDRFQDAAAMVDYVMELRQQEAQRERKAAGTAQTDSEGQTWGMGRPGRWRLWALGGALGCLLLGFATGYAYIMRLNTSSVAVAHKPPPKVAAARVPSAGPGGGAAGAEGGTPARSDVVKALEWLAENSLRENRLTEPPADNAYYYYSRLLAIDPDNPLARHGFAEIAEKYVVLAEQQFARRNYRKAQAYVTLGLQVQPDNEGLLALQSFIDKHERSVMDHIVNFLRGEG